MGTLSRAQTGRIEYKPEKVQLKQLVDEVASFTSYTFLDKQIQVRTNNVSDCMVMADQNMLKTILRNLLSNAGKFSQPGGQIELSCFQSKDWIQVSVKDQGVGMSPEQAATLFDTALNKSTRGTRNERGTGLGLKLCKEFVDRHDGKIDVSSVQGEGTTFSFTIPFTN